MFWLGAILFQGAFFSPNLQGFNIFKMKKQKCYLRGFCCFGFFLLKFLDSRCWIFKKYTWNLESYNEISVSTGDYCWPTARDQLIGMVDCCETSSFSYGLCWEPESFLLKALADRWYLKPDSIATPHCRLNPVAFLRLQLYSKFVVLFLLFSSHIFSAPYNKSSCFDYV